MRFDFQALPGLSGRSRPIIDLVVEGLDFAPQACLLDTGASEVRMGAHVAELVGLELDTADVTGVVVGGLQTTGRAARVQLTLRQSAHMWVSTVYFCDPWPWAFGLLGLAGLDPFLTIVDTYEEWVELQPLAR